MMFGWRKRIGLICPAVLFTTASDFYMVAPEGVGLYSVTNPIDDWRNDEYERSLERAEQTARYLASWNVHFIAHLGVPLVVSQPPEFMREFVRRLEEASGLPASTSLNSSIEAMRWLEADKIVVLTPFPPETHERIVSFLAQEGFSIAGEARLQTPFKELHLISQREAYDFWTQAVKRAGKAEAVYVPCPQWCTFEMTHLLELDTGVPFVTSDGADFWYPFKTLGLKDVKPGYGILLDRLSAVGK